MARIISRVLRVLEGDRQEKPDELNAPRAHPRPSSPPPVNWKERRARKNRLLLKWLGVLGITVAFSLVCVVLPLLVAHAPLGKTILLAMPPILFMTLSWMVGAWYSYDKNRQLGMLLTVGMTPVRLAFFGAWIWLAHYVPGLDMKVLLITMMIFWGVFTVPEIAVLVSFTNHLQRTSELDPEEDADRPQDSGGG
jgi:hypothetical protein